MNLDGRTALVTGASKNIGQAVATTLAEAGADVGVTALSDEEGCRETARRVESTGRDASVALGDLSNSDDVERVVEHVRSDLGPVDVLVNNATVRPSEAFLDVDTEDLDYVQDVNFRGMFQTTQHVVPDMLDVGRGSIVNLLGALVFLGAPGRSHSFGSKMAIAGMVRQLASELGPEGIRINGVAPGLIDTERETHEGWEATRDRVTGATPLRRMGTVEEIADVCGFLASEQASFVTGQVIHVNGGLYPTPNVVSGLPESQQ
jgi:3-oxoacyl-[acyl-carrier protein] reductase